MAEALDELRGMLRSTRAISFTGDSRDIIDYAAKLLGPGKLFCSSPCTFHINIQNCPEMIINPSIPSVIS